MKRVKEFYALVADDEVLGIEGVCMGWDQATGVALPAFCSDLGQVGTTLESRLAAMRRLARNMAKEGARRIRLVRFTSREELEIFHPDGRCERPRPGGA